MSGPKQRQIAEKTSEFELGLVCGDLAIISELIRKGNLTGMAEASRMLWNLWPVVQGREDELDWQAAIKAFLGYLKQYEERAREVGNGFAVEGRSGRLESG